MKVTKTEILCSVCHLNPVDIEGDICPNCRHEEELKDQEDYEAEQEEIREQEWEEDKVREAEAQENFEN